MRTGALLALLMATSSAEAAPITLVCTGSMTADGKQITINSETAILDLENHSFKPPMYQAFPLIRVGDSDLSFGSELPALSTWGNLDRVSGSLSMNVMRPDQRKALQAGGTAHFLVWMSGKCVPAQRMF